jgi:diphthamide biosynthesis enzyme Dph1/Dph2-like protein
MKYTLDKLEKNYDVELSRIVSEISSVRAKSVLLQLPDGLKPWGPAICDYLVEKTGVEIRIWLGACFGACDLPSSDVDLVVQFGHAPWEKYEI